MNAYPFMLIEAKVNKEDEKKPPIKPSPADVICQRGGRGTVGFDNIGNKIFRSLVSMQKVVAILKTK